MRKNYAAPLCYFAASVAILGFVTGLQAQQPEAPPVASGQAQAEAEAETEAAAQAEAEAKSEAEAEAKSQAEAEAESEAETEAKSEAEAEAESQAEAEAKSEAETEAESQAGAETEPRATGAEAAGRQAETQARGAAGLGIQFSQQEGQLIVQNVASGSALADLQANDQIIAVNDQKISTQAEFDEQLRAVADAEGPVTFTVLRDGEVETIEADLAAYQQPELTSPSDRTEAFYRGRMDAAQKGAAQKGAAQKGAAQKGAAQKGAMQKPAQKPVQKAVQKGGGSAQKYGAQRPYPYRYSRFYR